jgi:hypothetical protein
MRIAIAVVALASAACASAADPGRNPRTERFTASSATVLVTDSANVPLEVGGYPDFRPSIPQLLGGQLHLGSVAAGSSACFTIPDSILMFGTNVSSGQNSTAVWTSAQALTLSSARGYTLPFIPSSSVGWSITMPGSGVAPTQAARCSP